MFKRVFILAMVVGILVSYQNCGQYPAGPSAASDGRVGKIDPDTAEVAASDDQLVTQKISVAATALHANAQINDSLYNSIQTKVHECEATIGTDRTERVWELVDLYYGILEAGVGYTRLKTPDCEAVFKSEEGQLKANLEFICRREKTLAQYGPVFLESDQCPPAPAESITYGDVSKHFVRLSLSLDLPPGIPIRMRLLALDKINGHSPVDTWCDVTRQVAELGIDFSL